MRAQHLGMIPLLGMTSLASAGEVIYDNGDPDAANGYSNTIFEAFGARRTLLDDFIVPFGETWTLTGFEWHNRLGDLEDPPSGTGIELLLRGDTDGTPGEIMDPFDIQSYEEIQTTRRFFSGYETLSWVTFEPVVLEAGHYWFEGTIVSVRNNFWLTAAWENHEECWVNYDDLGGLQRGTDIFGQPSDLAWSWMGLRESPGEWACCFSDGSCLEMSAPDCEAIGALFQGIGVKCDLQTCGAPGACCFPDNQCVLQSELYCALDEGRYAGVGSLCAPGFCESCGELAPVQVLPGGDNAISVEIGDLNGDDRLDAVLANGGSASVSVFINAGDGSFLLPVTYGVGLFPIDVALGDMDGDTDLDAAVSNQSSDEISVLINNGDGTFAASVSYPVVGGQPWAVALADLDGDTDLDMVTNHVNIRFLSIFLGNGDGTFAPETRLVVPVDPRTVVTSDVDRDGDQDLITGHSLNDGTVAVFKNNGDATFDGWTLYPVSNAAVDIALGDLDDDGDDDLAVANFSDDFRQSVSVLFNDGTGAFGGEGIYEGGSDTDGVDVGDIDNDGDADIVAASRSPATGITVLLNDGAGIFTTDLSYPTTGARARHCKFGDVDANGWLDVVVALAAIDSLGVLLDDCPDCLGDVDRNGVVNVLDLIRVLSQWGASGVPEDIDGSGTVDFGDVLIVLTRWGACE